jgi:hypothetical protein
MPVASVVREVFDVDYFSAIRGEFKLPCEGSAELAGR